MSRLLVIDGNSILNRAFYGIMGSKMLMTKDGKYTNAVYGFLAIMFKVLDDLQPEYMNQQQGISYMKGTKQLERECQMSLHSKCQ